MKEPGVFQTTHPFTGEARYQAIAKLKGNYVLLGWWSTYERAMKAYKSATE